MAQTISHEAETQVKCVSQTQRAALHALIEANLDGLRGKERNRRRDELLHQLPEVLGVEGLKGITPALYPSAVAWLNGQAASDTQDQTRERLSIYRDGKFYLPHKNPDHVAGPREKALRHFWDTEYDMRAVELQKKFREMMDAINAAAKDGLFSHAVSNIAKDADTMLNVDSLLQGMYCAESMAHAAFKDAMELACLHMRMATSIATALNM